jgi:hypothetical protein
MRNSTLPPPLNLATSAAADSLFVQVPGTIVEKPVPMKGVADRGAAVAASVDASPDDAGAGEPQAASNPQRKHATNAAGRAGVRGTPPGDATSESAV